MSTTNVNNVLPTSGVVVNVNGANIILKTASNSLKINSSAADIGASQSTIIGKDAGPGTTGSANTFLGYNAGKLMDSGGANTIIGAAAGANCTGLGNTFLGSGSGGSVTTGNSNVFIGTNVGNSFGTVTGSDNICIGSGSSPATSSANYSITLGGSFTNILRCAQTSITSLSDARDKKEITELSAGLDFIKGLKPVEFVWDDRNEAGKHNIKDFGFIAQDLKKSQEDANLAETLNLVYEENSEKLEASYGKIIPILVKAIQELTAKVELLEAEKK
jgi:hypothetical protein